MKGYRDKNNHKKIGFIKFMEILALSILIISFAVLVYCVYVSFNFDESFKEDVGYKSETLAAEIENKDVVNNISDIIEKVNNSVVGISKIKDKGNTIFLNDGATNLGLGTGFIVSENGYIVTNEHVSGSRFSTCHVTLENGKSYTGTVVWADSDIDLSFVKINASNLQILTLGDSNNIKVAQTVYAIGNPIGFEFQRTVTSGIISGLDRTVKIEESGVTTYMEDLIQTDATINPGNSGGPLIDSSGNVLGVSSVKITDAEGIGFAIPINIVKPILEKLNSDGECKQATLGIFAYDKNMIPYINQNLGLNQSLENGLYIAQVLKNSPADRAGIQEGDIILEIDGNTLNKMLDLRQYIYSKEPGDTVLVKYLRNKQQNETTVVLVKK